MLKGFALAALALAVGLTAPSRLWAQSASKPLVCNDGTVTNTGDLKLCIGHRGVDEQATQQARNGQTTVRPVVRTGTSGTPGTPATRGVYGGTMGGGSTRGVYDGSTTTRSEHGVDKRGGRRDGDDDDDDRCERPHDQGVRGNGRGAAERSERANDRASEHRDHKKPKKAKKPKKCKHWRAGDR